MFNPDRLVAEARGFRWWGLASLGIVFCALGGVSGCEGRADPNQEPPPNPVPGCGDGTVDPGEVCDGNCPTSCDDGDQCTTDTFAGSVAGCSAQCSYTLIANCVDGDGCCPAACSTNLDSDCVLQCGNGYCELGESRTSCPADCVSQSFLGSSPDDQGWLEEIDGQLVLHVSGTGYSMGFQHGQLLRDAIAANINAFVYDGEPSTGQPPQYLLDFYQTAAPFIPQRFKDELQGMADGSGLSIDDLRALNVKPDANLLQHSKGLMCKQVAAWGAATVDGDLYHARSLGYFIKLRDSATGLAVQDHAIIYVAKPAGLEGYGMLTWPGIIGAISGLNQQGISLAINDVLTAEASAAGLPRPLKNKKVLEEATNLVQARSIMSVDNTVGYMTLVADGKVPAAFAVEITGQQLYAGSFNDPVESYTKPICDQEGGYIDYRSFDQTVMRIAGGYRSEQLAATAAELLDAAPYYDGYFCPGTRYENHFSFVEQQWGQLDATKLDELMKSDAQQYDDGRLHFFVFNATNLDMYITNALGSFGAHNYEAKRFNLQQLLATTPPVMSHVGAPTVQVDSVSSGDTVTGDMLVSGTSSSSQGIARVQLMVDDMPYYHLGAAGSFSRTIPSALWQPDSWHRIKVKATNTAGRSTVKIIAVKKDTEP